MKHLFYSLFVCFAFTVNAQVEEVKKEMPVSNVSDVKVEAPKIVLEKSNAKMTFESMIVDYGKIEQESDPLRIVNFTNTGTEPLVIKNARGSCGCTVPVWPKDPIQPGQSSTIEIRYDTKRLGKINKSVTITTNEGTDHVIQVVGEIFAKKESEAVPASTPNLIKGGE